MLDEEERAAIVASTKDVYDRNMLLMMAPLFRSEKIKWHLIGKKIEFRRCTLRRPVHVWGEGELLDRVILSLDDAGSVCLFRAK